MLEAWILDQGVQSMYGVIAEVSKDLAGEKRGCSASLSQAHRPWHWGDHVWRSSSAGCEGGCR